VTRKGREEAKRRGKEIGNILAKVHVRKDVTRQA
jgi:hypothetical protein